MKKDHGQESEKDVAKCTGRHHVAVIRPAQHRHIANHEAKQKEDAQPNNWVGNGEPKRMPEAAGGKLHGADRRHAAFQQQVTDVGAHNHRQDHDERLYPEPALASHRLVRVSRFQMQKSCPER